MAEKIIYTIGVDTDDATSDVNKLNESLDKINDVKVNVDINSRDINKLNDDLNGIEDVSIIVEANTTGAVEGIRELDDAMNGGVANADSLASSQTRLAATQGELNTTSSGAATQTGNLSREFSNNTSEARTNKESIDQVNVSLESLEGHYNGVMPNNLDEFLNGTTEASRKLITEIKALDAEVETIARSNVGFGASERDLADEIKKVTLANKDAYDSINQTAQANSAAKNGIDASSQSLTNNTDAVTKNGGAIAILDQITGGWATQIKNVWEARTLLTESTILGKVATKASTAAQWLWNTAIKANPIGAIVVAITALVSIGYALVSMFGSSTSAVEKNTAAINRNIDALDEMSGGNARRLKRLKKELKQELEILSAQGAKKEVIRAAEQAGAKKLIDEAQKQRIEAADNLRKANDTLRKAKYKAGNDTDGEDKEQLDAAQRQVDKLKAIDKASIQTLNDHVYAKLDLTHKYFVEDLKIKNAKKTTTTTTTDKKEIDTKQEHYVALLFQKKRFNADLISDDILRIEELIRINDEVGASELQRLTNEIAAAKEGSQEKIDLALQLSQFLNDNDENDRMLRQELGDAEIAEAQRVADAKSAIQQQYLVGIQQIGGAIGALAGESKAMAIASIVIEKGVAIAGVVIETQKANAAIATSTGIAQAGYDASAALYSAIPGASVPFKAMSVAAGIKGKASILRNNISAGISIAAIAASGIASASNPSGGGGGGDTGTVGGTPSAPTFNVVGQSPASSSDISTQTQTQNDNNDNNPIRAYVVSTEVTSQQALDRSIESDGSIG